MDFSHLQAVIILLAMLAISIMILKQNYHQSVNPVMV